MIDDKHNSNTELIAQGLGNICSALFGGIPATGAIARTAANVKNGGRSPIAGIVHAILLLLILVVLMPYAAWIPMPVIASILFVVAYNMSEWRHFVKICKSAPKSDILVLVATFVLTVVFDLVVAIEIGMLIALILFMKRMSDVTHVRAWTKADEQIQNSQLKNVPDGTVVYEINGPMFFASSDKFSFPLKNGTKVLILRMRSVPTIDASAIRSLHATLEICNEKGVQMIISHANEQPLAVMKKDGFYDKLGEDNFVESIDKALEKAKEKCE
jgi:SulP family sulfate permease